MKSASIATLSRALSPIVHNEVMALGYEYPKGAAKKQRTMPINIERDGVVTREMVPVVSGNSIRGIARRLLIDHTFIQLDINLEELIKNREDARKILFFFRNGGLTAKGTTALKTLAGEYENTLSRIPFLQLLGGVYQGHHFEGCAKVGIAIPITMETLPVIKSTIAQEHLKELQEKALPSVHDLFGETRYTRRASVGEPSDDKESMIYGTELIPAGTYFYSWASLVSHNNSVSLAFKAMYYLLSEYGYIGGMTGRGHGKMLFSNIYTDEDGTSGLSVDDYKAYVEYLNQNKKDIIEAIKELPDRFKAETKNEGKSKAKAK